MRSTLATLFSRAALPLLALALACCCSPSLAVPSAHAEESITDASAIDDVPDGAPIVSDGAEGGAGPSPLASMLVSSRTVVLPADTLSSFSVATVVTGVVELAGGADDEGRVIPTISTTYVAEGCVYSFDEETSELALVNAANAVLDENGVLVVPSMIELNGAAYPVTGISAGALCGTDVVVVALSRNVTSIDADAFKGVSKLQGIHVSSDNDIYSSYDGCLYDGSLSSLLLIPEGRVGAVRIPSGAKVGSEAFSHCASVGPIFVDAGSAASLSLADVELHNVDGDVIEVIVVDDPDEASALGGTDVPDGAPAPEDAKTEDADGASSVNDPLSQETNLASILAVISSGAIDEKVTVIQKERLSEGASRVDESDVGSSRSRMGDDIEANDPSDSFISSEALDALGLEGKSLPDTTDEQFSIATDGTLVFSAAVPLAATQAIATSGTVPTGTWVRSASGVYDLGDGLGKLVYDDEHSGVNLGVTYAPYLLTPDEEPHASWRLGGDTLYIDCEPGHVIDHYAFQNLENPGIPWKEVRSLVKKVVMSDTVQTTSMDNWFAYMNRLEDVTEFFVPDGCISLNQLFYYDVALQAMPSVLRLPDSAIICHDMFARCIALKQLPAGFSPSPSSINTGWMFAYCESLALLPDDFRLPEDSADGAGNPIEMGYMFIGCKSLGSLPAGFKVPDRATSVVSMFDRCDSLTVLPDGFRVPPAADYSFLWAELPGGSTTPVSTYCKDPDPTLVSYLSTTAASGNPASGFGGAGSAKSNRVLTTTKPAGAVFINLMVPDGDSWRSIGLRQADSLRRITDPGDPGVQGYQFGGWFVSQSLTIPYVFTRAYNQQFGGVGNYEGDYAIYAKLTLPHPVVSGSVPTGTWVRSADGAYDLGDGSGKLVYDEEKRTNVADGASYAPYAVTADPEPHASWRLENDTLYIDCEEGHVIDSYAFENGVPWQNVRSLVKRVVMSDTVQANSMDNWFAYMNQLEDASGFFVPDGCVTVNQLFYYNVLLSVLPDYLEFPDSLIDYHDMFARCVAIHQLPGGMKVSDRAIRTGWMFAYCESLILLPDGFHLPKDSGGVSGGRIVMDNMFLNCKSLASLPAGFKVPNHVVSLSSMFYGCDSLTVLPDGFCVPSIADQSFLWAELPSGSTTPVSTYCKEPDPTLVSYLSTTVASGNPASGFGGAGSAKSNRVLTTTKPAGAVFINLMVPDGDSWRILGTRQADSNGRIADPGDPRVAGYEFGGWFTRPTLEIAYVFDHAYNDQFATLQTYEGNYAIYAKLTLPHPVVSGSVPTGTWVRSADGAYDLGDGSGKLVYDEEKRTNVADGASYAPYAVTADPEPHASWRLENDTLYIDCEEGHVIDSYAFENGVPWQNVRSLVKRVVMSDTVQANSMDNWFAYMNQLEDASGFFVPNGCVSLDRIFYYDVSLKTLPARMRLPESVSVTHDMFARCASLEQLPAGLTLPDGVLTISWMFAHCESLASLPDGFGIPQDSVGNGQPILASYMFYGCTSLATLPVGFTLPVRLSGVDNMFAECDSLTVLPDSFNVPSGATESFLKVTLPAGTTTPLSTYCKNPDPSLVSYLSESTGKGGVGSDKTNRVLTSSAPSGKRLVNLMVPDGDQWRAIATVMTDENGKISDPGDPKIPGYVYSGWFCNSTLSISYVFDKPITEQLTTIWSDASGNRCIYAKLTGPMVSCDVPVKAVLAIDVVNAYALDDYETERTDLTFYSYNNASSLKIAGVECRAGSQATTLFAEAGDLDKLRLGLEFEGIDAVMRVPSHDSAADYVMIDKRVDYGSDMQFSRLDGSVRLMLNGALPIAANADFENVIDLMWILEIA